MIKFIAFAVISGTLVFASVPPKLTGDHICHRQENYTETINSTSSEPIQVRKNFWCIEKIRCSELQAEIKETVKAENVTKTRTVDFCCPDYEESELDGKFFCKPICTEKCVHGYCANPGKCDCEIGFKGTTCNQSCASNRYGKMCIKYCKCGDGKCHPQTGECMRDNEKIELSTTTMKANENEASKAKQLAKTEKMTSTEHNPYANFSGEYGKQYDHYYKMGLNESDIQESINKIVDMEVRKANEELRYHAVDDADGFIYLDIPDNEVHNIETLKHPQYISDHHSVVHHDETMAMVTVGCVIFGMLVFLLAMVYIRRVTRRVQSSRDIEAYLQKPNKLQSMGSIKTVQAPLPLPPPLRPSLRKNKSVSFDESVDEVDVKNRQRASSLNDAYDIPRKQSSLMDLYAQSVKITPQDVAVYTLTDKKVFNTFPTRKNYLRKQSLEHIYDEIPFGCEFKEADKPMSDKAEAQHVTESMYENQEKVEKTKM